MHVATGAPTPFARVLHGLQPRRVSVQTELLSCLGAGLAWSSPLCPRLGLPGRNGSPGGGGSSRSCVSFLAAALGPGDCTSSCGVDFCPQAERAVLRSEEVRREMDPTERPPPSLFVQGSLVPSSPSLCGVHITPFHRSCGLHAWKHL